MGSLHLCGRYAAGAWVRLLCCRTPGRRDRWVGGRLVPVMRAIFGWNGLIEMAALWMVMLSAFAVNAQGRRAEANIRTASGYEVIVPAGWHKAGKKSAGNVNCSVPVDQCQVGTGGLPSPNVAQIKAWEFSGSRAEADREAARSLAVHEGRRADSARTLDSHLGRKIEVRTLRWEYRSLATDPMPPLIEIRHYLFLEDAIVKVALSYWDGDPQASRYERECVRMVESIRRQGGGAVLGTAPGGAGFYGAALDERPMGVLLAKPRRFHKKQVLVRGELWFSWENQYLTGAEGGGGKRPAISLVFAADCRVSGATESGSSGSCASYFEKRGVATAGAAPLSSGKFLVREILFTRRDDLKNGHGIGFGHLGALPAEIRCTVLIPVR